MLLSIYELEQFYCFACLTFHWILSTYFQINSCNQPHMEDPDYINIGLIFLTILNKKQFISKHKNHLNFFWKISFLSYVTFEISIQNIYNYIITFNILIDEYY